MRDRWPTAGRVSAVLVTYRRPRALATMLARLSAQELPFETLVVVDNGNTPETRDRLREHESGRLHACAVSPGTNLGPTGGFALGMQRVAEGARPDDWILLLDDDNPPPAGQPRFLADLAALAARLADGDSRVGAVGAGGVRFDARRGRMIRVEDQDLAEIVPVDCIANSVFPLYRVAAVRAAGVHDPRLFFGFGELEYGLRLQAAGFRLYLAGASCALRRASRPRRDSGTRLLAPWRQYYGVRNLVHLLRTSGHPLAAARVSVAHGVLRPLIARPSDSRLRALRLTVRGACDGWRGHLGRVVEPVVSDS